VLTTPIAINHKINGLTRNEISNFSFFIFVSFSNERSFPNDKKTENLLNIFHGLNAGIFLL
jgi:hypothetical protein